MTVRANRVITGDSAEVFRELKRPHVMAAIWTGAWSDISMDFIDRLLESPAYIQSSKTQIPFPDIPELGDVSDAGARAFCADTAKFGKLFTTIGLELCGPGKAIDSHRIELPASKKFFKKEEPWHVDDRRLAMLSVPKALTTEILPVWVPGSPGRTDFYPDDKNVAEALARTIPNNALMIFKSASFSYRGNVGGRGLVHRRPTQKLRELEKPVRMVIHAEY